MGGGGGGSIRKIVQIFEMFVTKLHPGRFGKKILAGPSKILGGWDTSGGKSSFSSLLVFKIKSFIHIV